jgi:class 3 adenylate cyclase
LVVNFSTTAILNTISDNSQKILNFALRHITDNSVKFYIHLVMVKDIEQELAYYKKLTDELGGDNIRYDAVISATKTQVRKFTEGILLLNNLQAQIEAKTPLEEVMRIVLEAINTTLRMDKSMLLLHNNDLMEDTFSPKYWLGFEDEVENVVPLPMNSIEHLLQKREDYVIVTKKTATTDLLAMVQEHLKLPFFIAIPVFITGKMEGILLAGRKKEIKPFFPELNEIDVKIFQSIAAFLSVSITNSNIYQILERQVNQRTNELQKTLAKVKEQNKIIKQEKDKSDNLLLNILPEEVANELKQKGSAEAKLFNQVTVLFTDFVNFTGISEQLSPKELVAQINDNFSAIDRIIEKHGLEKIKTIGDAYLAVCGLPHEVENHAERTIKAAKEIIEYTETSQSKFKIRIGIHTGSVVAGIVGIKKFAYDIWGDAVNFAARMEQNSLSGKINISQTTYNLVKDEFDFEYRGKIMAKGKGEIDMYFVR